MIGFTLIGPLVKNGKKLFLYRLSFFTNALLLLSIIYLKENIIDHIWILGLILGLEKMFYWFPQNLLISQFANGNQIIKYTGYSYVFSGITKIIMPIILGYLITLNSFINTAIIVLVLTIIQLFLSFFLKETLSKAKKFNIKALWILATRREKIKNSLKIELLKGTVLDITDILIVLYIIYMFKTNLNLGIFTSIFAISAVTIDYILGKFCNFKSFRKILLYSSILVIIATSYFVFDTTKLSFIFYNLIFASAGEALRTITEINMYKISQDKSIIVHYRAEYMALRECVLNFGRIIGFGIIILISSIGTDYLLKYLILGLSMVLAYVGYLSIILSNQIIESKKAS
jgi:YQGE family putative transporter